MRSTILLLAAVALVAVQAAPVSNGPEAVATPNSPVKCFKDSDGKYECYGLGSVQPKAESAVPAFIPKCTKQKDGTLYCYGLNSVQPKASSFEPEAMPLPNRPPRCHKIEGVWECDGGDGPDPRTEPQASAELEAASVNVPPVRCGIVDGVWQCWGGHDPR
ncbi:hypothetical protein BGZ95_004495 [Linnemannia exigua]|uniref:Uncharacterized protein n=1 Tax=Linnemannia exigua TaxID=604196 RepID=A0AAD4H1S8_9FUNG|nr:hypothetical protein BGZ95_004495 [Linnemannia exigua]